ncbi:MAG: hypothetical protein IPP72_05840 [Chitinophagaceae bacterium]|nr:hypothetical protein [Chitinophagaceae bacterium]
MFGKTVDAKGETIHTIVTDVKDQVHNHTYHDTFMSIVWMAIYIITLWEIGRLIYEGFKKEKNNLLFFPKAKGIFQYVAQTLKPTFLASFVGIYIPLLIKLDVFEMVKPFFNKLSIFSINYEWYSWIYAYLVWELSTWVWHYAFHRVRFFWCFHSPHHAPDDLTITTAWVHFFAEVNIFSLHHRITGCTMQKIHCIWIPTSALFFHSGIGCLAHYNHCVTK